MKRMCVNSRNAKGEIVGGGVREKMGWGVFLKRLTAIILVAIGVIWGSCAAFAALPAPGWMPGSPLLAGNQVILLWTPVPGATKYIIYMNGKKVQESVSIQAIVPAPDEAGEFTFHISAVDASSAEGGKSVPGSIKVFKLMSPKRIEGRMIGKSVGLHWDVVGGAILYNLYRSTEKGKGFELIDSVQDNRFTDSKVQEGKTYYYQVTAKDASGKESAPSPEMMMAVVAQTTELAKAKKVVGLRTKLLFRLNNKDFTPNGIVSIGEPYDVEPSPRRSKFYVSSVNTAAVLMLDSKGEYLGEFGNKGDRVGQFREPYGIGIAPNGDVYVADFARNDVQVFDADGKFLRLFKKIEKADWMKNPPSLSDVAVDSSGNVHILDYRNGAVISYSPDGKELGHFSKMGPEANQTGYLTYLKVKDGKFYLGDSAKCRVLVTDKEGKTLKSIGQAGSGVGLLTGLGGFDEAGGKVYMTDRSTYLVQVYDLESGKYLYTLANEDNSGQMAVMAPKMVWVDATKNQIWVNQGIVNQIAAFEFFGSPEEAKGN